MMKAVDGIIGRAVANLIPRPVQKALPSAVRAILLIRPGGIGDAVHLIPAIRALRCAYPDSSIDILAEQRNSAVFTFCSGIRQICHYHAPADLSRLLRSSYDVVIDTEQWHFLSAVVARMTCAPVLIGFDSNARRRLFSHPVSYVQEEYEADSFLRLLAPLGIMPEYFPPPFLEVPHEAMKRVDSLLGEISNSVFVTIFPGASIPERRWGGAKFAQVAQLLAPLGVAVVVVGGSDDRRQGEEIVAHVRGVNLAGLTSLAETAAIIRKSALLLSGDSGVLHIAVGLGIPTVSLFGPGRESKWAPRGEHHLVINKKLPCSPCTTFGTTPPCPGKAQCMSDITSEEVFNAVTSLFMCSA